ncbi:MAG: hypothetical protein QM796_07285 [Chthoniobacteraceae bacterium]
MNLNIDADKKNTFDAIVVGTGISGGWAAKELTEKGLKTLVLGTRKSGEACDGLSDNDERSMAVTSLQTGFLKKS